MKNIMSKTDRNIADSSTGRFLKDLLALCGDDGVVQSEIDLQLASQDLFFVGHAPLAVVRPESTDQLARLVKLCRNHSVALFARGGGMSYTKAFQPTRDRAITVDFTRLKAIRAISAKDGYVTVEAGCTWAELDKALQPYDRRARFWGPMSGRSATIGGSISQGSVTFGSGTTGASANSVKSFEIVTGTGAVIHSGSDGSIGTGPENRNFGPDLTGIFANDAGALGIKTAITLEIEPRLRCVSGLSFAYEDFRAMAHLFGELTQRRLASEIIAMDGNVARQNAGPADLVRDARAMWMVGKAAGNPIAALSRMGRIALGGRRFLDRARYTAHFVVEGRDKRELSSRIAGIRKLARSGREIVNTVPLMTRAMPFPELPVTHPDGRRMLPIHGIFPPSAICAFHADYNKLKDRFAEQMSGSQVTIAEFFAGIAGVGMLYEPVFYWPDELSEYHRRLTPDYLHDKMPNYCNNPAARSSVTEFTAAFVNLVRKHGGTHFQLGRLYPYAVHREQGAGDLIRAIKNTLDPDNIINPGALGL